jgi:hypothetical protein
MTQDKFGIVRIHIPGDWRDVWLYKEHMLLWSRDGFLHVVPVRQIIRHLEQEVSLTTAVILEHLLFRNDWKASEQFRRMLEIPSLRKLFAQSIRECSKNVVVVPASIGGASATESAPGVLLDAEIYANRVYLATTEGLFESYFSPKDPLNSEPLFARLEHRVSRVAARYGSVNAAAEDKGLWFAQLTFGEDRLPEGESERFQRIADQSLSVSFSSRNLLNYTEDPIPAFLRANAVRERLHTNANWEEWRVLGYERPTDISRLARFALRSASRRIALKDAGSVVDVDESVTALGNWEYRLLLAWQGALHTVNLSAYDEHDIEARSGSFHRVDISNIDPEADILSTYPIAGGFLAELFDRILLITPNGAQAFFAGPAARIRTFLKSRRYQDVAAVVEEHGVSLVGSFDLGDTPLY